MTSYKRCESRNSDEANMFQFISPREILHAIGGRSFEASPQADSDDENAPSFYDRAIREDGLLAGTLVDTGTGWRAAESIRPGEKVMTFDNGLREVIGNRSINLLHSQIPAHKRYIMLVPRHALGNCTELALMPMQEVIIESDRAEDLYGDPFVLIPSLMLVGYRGIHRVPMTGEVTLSLLSFEREEVILTQGDMLALGHADSSASPLQSAANPDDNLFPRLTERQLQELVTWEMKGARPCPAFAEQSIDDLHAALEARAS